MALFFLRHTRTAIPEAVCYGALDVALGETFEAEFTEIRKNLPRFERIISSPLTRCLSLAERVAEMNQLNITTDNRILEMNFGSWQGQDWSDIPRHEIDAWAEEFENYRGHGGESVHQLRARVQSFLADLDPAVDTLIVSHSGVIRSALTILNNSDEREIKVAYGELIQLN